MTCQVIIVSKIVDNIYHIKITEISIYCPVLCERERITALPQSVEG